MLNEIYIDNFKCLTNFRINPNDFQLWLGDNGSGKTSVLDALRSVQRLMRGGHVADIFNCNSLTTWDKRRDQTIGCSLRIDDSVYKYELTIEYTDQENKLGIKKEKLTWNDVTFFLFDGREAHLYRINGKDHDFEFMNISDGQRQLIVLYTILEALRAGIFSTILIDEPDNFVFMREIQPWLENLDDISLEATALRRRQAATVLLVVQDADELPVAQVRSGLDGKLQPPRGNAEPIVYVIPKWHIQTWIAYLAGETVDEAEKDTYRNRYGGISELKDAHPFIDKLADNCRRNLRLESPPGSLAAACEEFKRIRGLS